MKRNDIEKISYLLRKDLESPKRRFVWNGKTEMSYEKKFRYTSADQRLLAFAQDTVCMTSDCFILYALSHMGVADAVGISLFLEALAKKNPALNIVHKKDSDGMVERLKVLARMGYIFCFYYSVDVQYDDGIREDRITLYSLIDSGYDIVRQRFQKKLTVNSAFQYKPLQEVIGWSSATFVGANIARSAEGFECYLDRVFKSRQMACQIFMPMEMKTEVEDVLYYISVFSSFLIRDSSAQTDMDYNEMCAYKINAIKNYLAMRTEKGVAISVVSVYDNADLMEISDIIYKTDVLKPYLRQIYFTGEGIIRERRGDVKNSFLQMVLDENEDIGYRFEYAEPCFM